MADTSIKDTPLACNVLPRLFKLARPPAETWPEEMKHIPFAHVAEISDGGSISDEAEAAWQHMMKHGFERFENWAQFRTMVKEARKALDPQSMAAKKPKSGKKDSR